MFAEFKAGQDLEKRAAIADHFRELDNAEEMDNPDLLPLLMSTYIKQYGAINYRMLEEIFRANNFKTHFLAIPRERILTTDPHPRKVVADTNTLFMDNVLQPTTFGARAFNSKASMLAYIMGNEDMSYDPDANLRNLSMAGGIYFKPRSRRVPLERPKNNIATAHLN
jgi:hypothetical protein